ncbi:MAG: hypothetical protein MUO54_15590 [Anaerolineales bacterium]|nr:hypothetical protein [Anaerolineales bacterium]
MYNCYNLPIYLKEGMLAQGGEGYLDYPGWENFKLILITYLSSNCQEENIRF